MLRLMDERVEILDLNSKHGLSVNNEPKGRSSLSEGDEIQIGKAVLTVIEVKTPEVAGLGAFGGYLDDDDDVYTLAPAIKEPPARPSPR